MGIDLRDKNLSILDEGVDVSSGTSSINFEGSGVNVASVGDNVTVTIPGGTGNTTFYLNQSVAQTPYKEFSSIVTSAVEQVVPLTVAGGATSVIAEYMTPTGFPGTTQIPAGLWQLFLHFNAGAVGQNWIIRPTVYKRSSGGTETLLFTADPEIVTGMSTTTTMFTCDGVFPSTTLLTTDRILVRISVENTSGVSQTVNFRTEGSQHYSVIATTLNQVVPSGGGSSAGIFGISNAAGVYTYYATLTLAMAAATSGQVIEMFADVTETGAVSVNLKTGVNINGNGHTYTLSNNGTSNCIQDNAAAVNCSISNITFKRMGGTFNAANTLCMYITGASKIKCYSTILIGGTTNLSCITINNASAEVYGIYAEGYNPTATITNGLLSDSTIKAISGNAINVASSGRIVSCVGYGIGGGGIVLNGTATDCQAYDSSAQGFLNSGGTAIDCTGQSAGANGFTAGSGTSINCIGYSTAAYGFYSNGAVNIMSCKGYSTAYAGIAMVNGIAYDSLGYSSVSHGLYASNAGAISEFRSCTAISLAAMAIFIDNTASGCKIYNTEIISKWNNIAGHGIKVTGANAEIINCNIEVANATANAINVASALTVKYANNAFKGATTAVNASVTQGISNISDTKGNIVI
jgi:hypothetical protein